MRLGAVFIAIILLPLSPTHTESFCRAQTGAAAPHLKIGGNVTSPLELSAADFKKLPRTTVKVANSHDKKMEAYEGVQIVELLRRAGAPQGHQLRGPVMASYVLASASDGYRALFSVAALDPDFSDVDAIVADTMDGAPLGANEGPFKLVVPHDKRPARWVRMLSSLTVVQLGKRAAVDVEPLRSLPFARPIGLPADTQRRGWSRERADERVALPAEGHSRRTGATSLFFDHEASRERRRFVPHHGEGVRFSSAWAAVALFR